MAAARTLGRQLTVLEARSVRDFESAFAAIAERKASALAVGASALFTSNRDKLLSLVARDRIPAVYSDGIFVVEGGLMSYGASAADAYRLGGLYVGEILKGAKPSDLPFQQSTKFELVINLKAAKSLGIEVPMSLLMRVDEVTE